MKESQAPFPIPPLHESYIKGFDILRVISIIAVVGIHSFSNDVTLFHVRGNLDFAVPSFILMSIYLSSRLASKVEHGAVFIRQRLGRLAPAFFIWTAIYVLARYQWGNIRPLSVYHFMEYAFLGSAALHLYFIPLIFYYSVGLAVFPKSRLFRRLLCTVGLGLSIWLQHANVPQFGLSSPEASAFPFYFISNLPYLFLSALLFELIESSRISRWLSGSLALVAFLCGLGTITLWGLPYFSSMGGNMLRTARDSFLFLTFRFWPFKTPRWLVTFSGISFGIYLSHHIVMEGLLRVQTYIGLFPTAGWLTLVWFAIGISVMVTFCLVLKKGKGTAWLVR